MREIFTYGSVGRAPGNWCLYPECNSQVRGVLKIYVDTEINQIY